MITSLFHFMPTSSVLDFFFFFKLRSGSLLFNCMHNRLSRDSNYICIGVSCYCMGSVPFIAPYGPIRSQILT